MTSVMGLWNDALDLCREGAEAGKCTCAVFPHVTSTPDFMEATDDMLAGVSFVLEHSTPEAVTANLGHFITAILAVGYALGASDAYDITLSSDVNVPDSLAALDFIESNGREGSESD